MHTKICLLFIFFLCGCSLLPADTTTSNCTTNGFLFADNFDEGNVCGWVEYDDRSERVTVENGTLQMTVNTTGFMAWTNPRNNFTDVEINAQTRQLSGPDNNAFGTICRYLDEDNFYLFLISGDGYYAIGKFQTGSSQIQYLTGESPNHFIASDHINQGTATNQLRVRCIGNQLSLFVNGFLLEQVTDTSFESGDIGLAATVWEPGALSVEFDNVQVTLP